MWYKKASALLCCIDTVPDQDINHYALYCTSQISLGILHPVLDTRFEDIDTLKWVQGRAAGGSGESGNEVL